MLNIGIDTTQNLIYEGNGSRGRGIWPSPVITHAKFIFSKDEIAAETSSNVFGYRFREDSFDPISRIRRGRFYCADGSQPQQWIVSHHPGNPFDAIAPDIHGHSKGLETFYGNPIWHKYISGRNELPVVLLGVDDRYTVWTIISIEAIYTGEDLVTLKARSSFGILPKIIDSNIPVEFKNKIEESMNAFADEVHRASPISIIDRARDTATYIILAYFNLGKEHASDLGILINKLKEEKLSIAADTANIIARLHARAKPSEQEKRNLPAIKEQDAEIAIQCIGTLLCELNLAVWK